MKTCTHCATPFDPRRNGALYCTQQCRQRAMDARRRARRVASGDLCQALGCGNPRRSRGLCKTHYNQTYLPGSQKLWPGDLERARRKDLAKAKRRRAATRGVTAEMVDRYVVGERDGWRCGICRRKVDQRKTYPHPMSASLDHVVPLSQGGEHTYSNTRISHLRCNVVRCDRGGDEQLALIG